MMTFRSLVISILPLILLSVSIDALRYRSVRHKRAAECPNTNNNTCNFVTCEHGGQCIEDSTTLDCFKCQCTAGYTGKVCDTSIVITPGVCNPVCQNGGFCNVNVCECPTGYTGTICEIRDFCLPTNPCQNGGQCTSTGVNYQCDCTGTGYTGTVCTDVIPTNPCASNPCQNGGQCRWDGVTMNCICYNDYFGAFCQIPPVPCASAPCENGGQCELLAINTYGCKCPEEFTGSQCETSILVNHPCVTMPATVCLNGGNCTVNGPNYLCKCATGWTGTNCEIQEVTSSCSPDPCGVHATCYQVNLPIGPTVYCYCENRWTGKYCDVNMDANCPVGHCITGTCQMVGNVPQCDCPALYTGQRCETFLGSSTTTDITTTDPIGVNGCFSSPCMNGGTCYGNTDTYRCECVDPWSGPLCEIWSGIITTTEDPTGTPVIDACSLSPCYNGGTCYPSGNDFTCVCTPTFTGTLCETTTDPLLTTTDVPLICVNQPCQNGGTCVAVGASYSCFCGLTSIYTGQNCDSTGPMSIDECPLDCRPGRCIFSGNPVKPYACLWNGVMRPIDGTTA